MGSIPRLCRRCGSTRIGGRCDCSNSPIIDTVECAYCGTHMQRGAGCSCRSMVALPGYSPNNQHR